MLDRTVGHLIKCKERVKELSNVANDNTLKINEKKTIFYYVALKSVVVQEIYKVTFILVYRILYFTVVLLEN